MKLYRSPLPLLGVLVFLVVAIPLMDHILLGIQQAPVEKTLTAPTPVYASTQEPCNNEKSEQELAKLPCE
ncbi:MAG: hypothetical protein AAF694_31345 [Bacteroidota bacterium]